MSTPDPMAAGKMLSLPDDDSMTGKVELTQMHSTEQPPKADTTPIDKVDRRDPFDMCKLDALLADPSALEGMSEHEIAAALGQPVFDRSLEKGPEGDGTLHELEQLNVIPASPAAPAPAPAAAAPAAPAPAAPAPAAAAPAPAPAAADTPAFVETRDGRGRIPHSVLQNERSRRQEAERRAAEAEARIAQLTGAGPAPAVETPTEESFVEIQPSEVALFTPEQIAALSDRYDKEIVDILVSQNKVAVAAFSESQRLRQENVVAEQNRRVTSVQDFIDGNPLASQWQSTTDPAEAALFDEAIQTDEMLKAHAVWGTKPWQERMAEAVRRTAVANNIAVPAAGGTAPAPALTAQQIQARTQAALAAAAANPLLPVSHSDLPGGAAAHSSEADSVAAMSPLQLADKLASMTPQKMMEFIGKVA